jgi:hypothetical protein
LLALGRPPNPTTQDWLALRIFGLTLALGADLGSEFNAVNRLGNAVFSIYIVKSPYDGFLADFSPTNFLGLNGFVLRDRTPEYERFHRAPLHKACLLRR